MKRAIISAAALFVLAPQPVIAQDGGAPPPSFDTAKTSKRLMQHPPADAKTDPPSAEQWKKAALVELERPLPENCKARLHAEWLRIRCRPRPTRGTASGSLLSGDHEGVGFYLDKDVADIVMPLRRGTRRIAQLTRANGGYEGVVGQDPMLLVSMQWLGSPGPIVTASPVPYRGPFRGMHAADKEETEKVLGEKMRWHAPYVLKVDPGSPAAEAKLKPGDKIVATFSGEDAFSTEDMFNYVVFAGGDRIKMAVMRGKQASVTPFWLPIGPAYQKRDE